MQMRAVDLLRGLGLAQAPHGGDAPVTHADVERIDAPGQDGLAAAQDEIVMGHGGQTPQIAIRPQSDGSAVGRKGARSLSAGGAALPGLPSPWPAGAAMG
jgi:hypothetical protein